MICWCNPYHHSQFYVKKCFMHGQKLNLFQNTKLSLKQVSQSSQQPVAECYIVCLLCFSTYYRKDIENILCLQIYFFCQHYNDLLSTDKAIQTRILDSITKGFTYKQQAKSQIVQSETSHLYSNSPTLFYVIHQIKPEVNNSQAKERSSLMELNLLQFSP